MSSEYNSMKRKEYYNHNKEIHICTKCYKPIKPDEHGEYKTLCQECLNKQLERKYKGKDKQGEAKKHTLCWRCRNAVPKPDDKGGFLYGCEWSISRRPVEGWIAKKGVVKAYTELRSYLVIRCPKFIKDPPRKKAEKSLNTQEKG
ncbi:MAG: hypothetical protein IJ740_18865 [Ruminococcus sp.]|nr:hypothetical protein [Ruminococcus sp.]MBR1752904.1 hypothetical protein [Ruminococcus sp.]